MKLSHLATSLLLLASPLTLANGLDFPHLVTQGKAQITAEPDMASLQVTVSIIKKDAKEAKTASDKAVVDFSQRLIEAGVKREHINSANLDLQPSYEYHNNAPRQLVGYQANRTVTVTIEQLSQLNDILNSAIEQGLNRVDNIQLSSSKMAELQQQARQAAIKDAQSNAADVAKGFGSKLAGVWQISYLSQEPIRPVMYRMAAMADSSPEMSYQQGQITVSDSVEVIYKIKP
ncbi:oxidative stress defense protein [Shewanella sp. SNU WT4]|uniref:oxidative stress defense protein n=1 Tax=Shewanella sp. SNU WT4 TaxID=2590015 RepID=UPI00112AA934|nr:oxidative stress defense protein [Shewanella sp. SNU WT4]QDF65934.1 oxidative stress defense protein [Shewanella sp. SNU WT4]